MRIGFSGRHFSRDHLDTETGVRSVTLVSGTGRVPVRVLFGVQGGAGSRGVSSDWIDPSVPRHWSPWDSQVGGNEFNITPSFSFF